MANKYWSCHDILQIDAQYYMLLGPRGTGKSHSLTKHVLQEAYNSDTYQFAYLKRYDLDIKNDQVTSYFAEIDVEAITGGEYNSVRAVRGWIYFAKVNEENERDVTYSRKIGKSFALSAAEHYKSLKYPNIVDIVFEEFTTDSLYLQNEPSKLQELVSTILRDRPGHVWLVGNTISKVSPYFYEWGLQVANDKVMKDGEIKIVEVHGKDNKDQDYCTKIAVEICVAEKSATGMFFGQRGKSITGAQVWTGDRHAHLPGGYSDYEMMYEIKLTEFNFNFVIQLLINNESGDLVNYIYPLTTNRSIERCITSEFCIDMLTTNCLNVTIKAEKIMKDLFKLNKYCFSDDMTGDDFEHVLQNRKGVL